MKKYIIIAVVVIIAALLVVRFNTRGEVYSDNTSNFSIVLDNGWKLLDKGNSSTTSSTLFGNGSSTIVVKKFDRTDSVNQAISFMGNQEFGNFLAEQIKMDIGNQYEITATSSIMINGISFLEVDAKYIAPKTKKEVTQKTYITINDKAYYIIGTDIYTDILNQNLGQIEKIINTFKLK